MNSQNFLSPSLADWKISALLHADDVSVMSFIQIGLRRMLVRLADYCETEERRINDSKTKTVVSGNNPKHRWSINIHVIEQCPYFKYLGITFQASKSWQAHFNITRLTMQHIIAAIPKFFFSKGGQLILPALEVFQNKVIVRDQKFGFGRRKYF